MEHRTGYHCVLSYINDYPTILYSMWGYLVYCMYVCLFVCTVTDFSAAEKDRGVKFCTRVRLLVAWSSGRAVFFGRCAFAVLRSTSRLVADG